MKQAMTNLLELIDGYRRALLKNYSEHDLHQLRVSVRRLRGLLRFVDGKEARKLRREWGELISQTNVIRDWDTLANYATALPDQQAADTLASAIHNRRVENWQNLRQELDSPIWQQLEQVTEDFLERSADLRQALPEPGQTTLEARTRLATAWQRARDQNSDRAWHKLRIAVKDLRYSLDTLASEEAAENVELCKQLQEALGRWHDSVIHGELLLQLANTPGTNATDYSEAVRSLAEELRQQGEASLALVNEILAKPGNPLILPTDH